MTAQGSGSARRANVYVDGFNLYYGCLRDTGERWLDIAALIGRMFSGDAIGRIRYFTARVKAVDGDPQKPTRQQVYLRALSTLPNLEIHEGSYQINRVLRELVTPLPDGTTHVRCATRRKRGPTWRWRRTCSWTASGESTTWRSSSRTTPTCAAPSRWCGRSSALEVVVVAPCSLPHRYPSAELSRVATSLVTISAADLRASQLPTTLTDRHGTITKPATW